MSHRSLSSPQAPFTSVSGRLSTDLAGSGSWVWAGLIAAKQELAQTIKSGLKDGGKQIGRLERALIFAFILVGEPTGIGFLVAAKSILRFEEAKQQPVAEYVIIGTLWSFGLAIVLSWLTLQAINSVIPS